MTKADLIEDRKRLEIEYAAKRSILDKLIDRWTTDDGVDPEVAPRCPADTGLRPPEAAVEKSPARPRNAAPRQPVPGKRGAFKPGSVRSQIMDFVGEHNGEVGIDQIKARFPGVPHGTISSLIHKLIKLGWLERIRFGWYERTNNWPAKTVGSVERDYLKFKATIASTPATTETV